MFVYRQDLITFKEIRISSSQKYLRKLYYSKEYLDRSEYLKLRGKLKEIEQAINRLSHLRSIVDKILLRNYIQDD